MQTSLLFFVPAGLVILAFASGTQTGSRVNTLRVPAGGIQPEIELDSSRHVHLVYFSGEPKAGNLSYVHSGDGGATFSSPIRVNSQPGSAVALGTIRGGQMAIGKDGRVHVAWNGSGAATPRGPVNPETHNVSSPMLYARMNDARTGFEPQRNLMTKSVDLDGGGTVAADDKGDVLVAWHGHPLSAAAPGEAGRQVVVARSTDEGKSFATETPAWNQPTGACGCCGMRMFAGRDGTFYGFYRSATENVHRDMYLLVSKDRGSTFQGELVQKWNINACPMSSEAFAENGSTVEGAWETGGQVYFAKLSAVTPIAAPGEGKGRKHPRLAINDRGETMLVWTEGTGWNKGGNLAWQIYDASGKPTTDHGTIPGLPAWSFGAVYARPDGGFTIVY